MFKTTRIPEKMIKQGQRGAGGQQVSHLPLFRLLTHCTASAHSFGHKHSVLPQNSVNHLFISRREPQTECTNTWVTHLNTFVLCFVHWKREKKEKKKSAQSPGMLSGCSFTKSKRTPPTRDGALHNSHPLTRGRDCVRNSRLFLP